MNIRKGTWKEIVCFLLVGLIFGCGGNGETESSLGGTNSVSVDQLPVHIVYVNHVEVESVLEADYPLMDGMVYVTTPEKYAETKAMLEWEVSQAEAVGGKISFHMSGAFAEQAMAAGDMGLWENHINQGHTVGVHTHGFLRGSNVFEWVYKTVPTQSEINKHWTDNYDLTAGLAGAAQLWIGESHFGCRACWEELGYKLTTTESMALLPEDQHIVWQVQRSPQGYITYPHFPQIGKAGYHGSADNRKYFDLRLPQLKKEFLMLYLEWLERERLGLAPQVFVWGWCNHGGVATERYSEEIMDMLNWLNNNFAGKTSPRGNHIARFVSDHELSDIYETYEQSGGEPMPSSVNEVNDQFS